MHPSVYIRLDTVLNAWKSPSGIGVYILSLLFLIGCSPKCPSEAEETKVKTYIAIYYVVIVYGQLYYYVFTIIILFH